MSAPGWVECLVTDGGWEEVPIDWLLDPSTGRGQDIGVNYGEGIIWTNLGMAPSPGWQECLVTDGGLTECLVTQVSWTEVRTDS